MQDVDMYMMYAYVQAYNVHVPKLYKISMWHTYMLQITHQYVPKETHKIKQTKKQNKNIWHVYYAKAVSPEAEREREFNRQGHN